MFGSGVVCSDLLNVCSDYMINSSHQSLVCTTVVVEY